MQYNKEKGYTGEDIAVNFLISKGYKVLERNWRYRRNEIDIIAWHGSTLVFVEVKTRSSLECGHPREGIDKR